MSSSEEFSKARTLLYKVRCMKAYLDYVREENGKEIIDFDYEDLIEQLRDYLKDIKALEKGIITEDQVRKINYEALAINLMDYSYYLSKYIYNNTDNVSLRVRRG